MVSDQKILKVGSINLTFSKDITGKFSNLKVRNPSFEVKDTSESI